MGRRRRKKEIKEDIKLREQKEEKKKVKTQLLKYVRGKNDNVECRNFGNYGTGEGDGDEGKAGVKTTTSMQEQNQDG